MPVFNIEVQWHYRSFDFTEVPVNKPTLEEAKDEALRLVAAKPDAFDWTEGQVIDGNFEVNDMACGEATPPNEKRGRESA